MQLTNFTDYALRTLLFLASLPEDEQSNIAEISTLFNVSRNHISKVINRLANLDYIQTVRGKNGGVRLNRAANTIVIGKVIEQLEPLELVNCSVEACHITPACRLKHIMEQAKARFLHELHQYTIEDLLSNNSDLLILLTRP